MKGVNRATIVATVGRDPEIRYTASGNAVTTLSAVTSEKWKDKNTGEDREEKEWHRIVMFGRMAEVAGQYIQKGSLIYVEGKIKTRSYEKDGSTRYSTEIVANDMQMLSSSRDRNEQPANSSPRSDFDQKPANAPPGSQNSGPKDYPAGTQSEDDIANDIPF